MDQRVAQIVTSLLVALALAGEAIPGAASDRQWLRPNKGGFEDSAVARHHARAIWLLERGEVHAGIIYLEAALKLQPRNVLALYNRGKAYYLTGRFDRATADFAAALAIEPDIAPARMNRGAAYANIGRLDEAIADLNETVRLYPAGADGFFNRGTVLLMRKEPELALKDFNDAIRLNENDATYFANRGLALEMLGRRAEARSDYERALELNPEDGESRAHLRSLGAGSKQEPARHSDRMSTRLAGTCEHGVDGNT
jgi:tetratricopeptide (TPR) repeat protein